MASQSNGRGEDNIPLEEAHEIINAYTMAFAQYHLFGDATGQALIDGSQTLHDGVILLKKGPSTP